MMKSRYLSMVLTCALAWAAGCAGSIDTDPELETAPERSSSAHLFGEADGMIADANADGAERACALARDALEREALEGDAAARGDARAAFCVAEVTRLRWESIRMDSQDMKQLKTALDSKVKGMQELQARYQAVYTLEVLEWTLAAGTREASSYEHFASMLVASPTPGGFDEETAAMYHSQLEDIADPLFDEARKRYELVVAKADEHGISTAYIDMARASLARLP